MCRAFQGQGFDGCGHGVHGVFYDWCDEATKLGRTCSAYITDRNPKIHPVPKKCVHCYRRYEKATFDFHNERIKNTESEIKRREEALRDNQTMNQATRQELKRQIRIMQDGITIRVTEREKQLSEFRKAQGVWGDG